VNKNDEQQVDEDLSLVLMVRGGEDGIAVDDCEAEVVGGAAVDPERVSLGVHPGYQEFHSVA
jgi:hypothetical protein